MKTTQHFKDLCDIVKAGRIGAYLLYSSMLNSPRDMHFDVGFSEATVDPDGNYVRFAQRESNSDTTIISTRMPDGSWEKHSYTPVKQPNGTWKVETDLPTVYQLRLKEEAI